MKTILIVEDDVDNQDLYRRYLQHRGYEVLQAWDGESGILMAQEHQPDLIIMDCQRRLRMSHNRRLKCPTIGDEPFTS